jgi:hypothetical protein
MPTPPVPNKSNPKDRITKTMDHYKTKHKDLVDRIDQFASDQWEQINFFQEKYQKKRKVAQGLRIGSILFAVISPVFIVIELFFRKTTWCGLDTIAEGLEISTVGLLTLSIGGILVAIDNYTTITSTYIRYTQTYLKLRILFETAVETIIDEIILDKLQKDEKDNDKHKLSDSLVKKILDTIQQCNADSDAIQKEEQAEWSTDYKNAGNELKAYFDRELQAAIDKRKTERAEEEKNKKAEQEQQEAANKEWPILVKFENHEQYKKISISVSEKGDGNLTSITGSSSVHSLRNGDYIIKCQAKTYDNEKTIDYLQLLNVKDKADTVTVNLPDLKKDGG